MVNFNHRNNSQLTDSLKDFIHLNNLLFKGIVCIAAIFIVKIGYNEFMLYTGLTQTSLIFTTKFISLFSNNYFLQLPLYPSLLDIFSLVSIIASFKLFCAFLSILKIGLEILRAAITSP